MFQWSDSEKERSWWQLQILSRTFPRLDPKLLHGCPFTSWPLTSPLPASHPCTVCSTSTSLQRWGNLNSRYSGRPSTTNARSWEYQLSGVTQENTLELITASLEEAYSLLRVLRKSI